MTDAPYRTFVVVNPRSGNGATGRRFERIAAALGQAVGPFEHAFTRAPGDATGITREALARGFEMIVAVGGDGTFNEVVDGFFEAGRPTHPDAVFAVVPQGTGGDLRRTLGLDVDLAQACARLRGRGTRDVDVGLVRFQAYDGTVRRRAFINIADFGVGGLVVERVNRSTKMLGGRVSFAIGSLRALARWRDVTVRVRFDDGAEETMRITNLAVCNGQYFGGGMQVAPRAALDDGRFDVTIWRDYGFTDFVFRGRMLYDGTHLQDPRTRVLRARTIEADSDEEVLLDVDGEQPGRLPARFTLLPGALRLKC